VAIVTGGGRGIGRAIARALAGAGAQVAVAARSADQLAETVAQIERDGGHAIATPVDVTDAEGVVAVVQRVTRDLGPVDLLVNNAGSFAAIGPVWEVDPEQWWRDVETNLRGTFHCARAVLPGMIERGHGTIVNLSGGGSTNAFPYGSGYGSSKAAIVRFSEVLAKEAEKHGIYVYAMGPGLVRTAMTEYQLTTPQGQRWLPRIARSFEDGRNVPPERAGQLAVFLASLATQHPTAAAALSGRAFGVADNPDDLLRRAESIQQADHYTLRLSR
jgi:NAD(P)-dependent dehydrogenase (short-subunit alcohol dehydrogenase family)